MKKRLLDILIIDDSAAFNKLTRRSFEKAGLECCFHEESNGRRALDYLASIDTCPDIILLDMNMPVMDGFDFLEEYKKNNKCLNNTVVYMLSSSSQESDRARAQLYPTIRAYFEKPLTFENITFMMDDFEGLSN